MATELSARQAEIVKLRGQGMSVARIAGHLGIGVRRVYDHLAIASAKGSAPGLLKTDPVDGMTMTKTTVQYGADGKPVQEWRRLAPEFKDIETWIDTLCERIVGKAPKIKAPKGVQKDLLLEIPIPDHHMGMLAWAKETRGEDYDCDIATKLLTGAVASVIQESPRPGKIVLTVLGDFYHADSRSQTTERSGHVLDCDSRFSRRVDAGIDALCQCVELAAAAAAEVEVVCISGNHDWHSIKWLARVLMAYYKDSKRITIRPATTPRQYVQFGQILLAYMHGDCLKASKFAELIPAEVPEMWAKTRYRYGRVGHWHHRSTEERAGVVIETLPTLAAPDSYAAEHGYMSRRALTAFLWHKQFGLRAKMERSPEEVVASMGGS